VSVDTGADRDCVEGRDRAQASQIDAHAPLPDGGGHDGNGTNVRRFGWLAILCRPLPYAGEPLRGSSHNLREARPPCLKRLGLPHAEEQRIDRHADQAKH
jgi:hypothetical protein